MYKFSVYLGLLEMNTAAFFFASTRVTFLQS